MRTVSSFVRSLLLVATLLGSGTAAAQVGSTTDILTGRVVGASREPVANAQVSATSVETRVTRTARTNARGVYTIVFPDGGGQYQLTVRALGAQPVSVNVVRQGDEDRLVANIDMTPTATQLSAVRIQARTAPPQGGDRPEPGNAERSFGPEQAARLPVEQSDLNALAALAPGVVPVAGSDSTGSSFSVSGQRPTQNNLTLDGLSFGSAQVPNEAVRSTRVITSTYDVARGQFTGGQIATTTRSGTNVRQGSASLRLNSSALQWTPSVEGPFGQGFDAVQLSGGMGGPIVQDKLFWFGALLYNRRESALQSLVGADPLSLERLGTSPDSVSRFLGQLGTYGLPATLDGIPDDRLNDGTTGILRVDWNLLDAHTLTLRGDYRTTGDAANRIGATSVPVHGGDETTTGGGVQLSLTSRFGASLINEAKGYVSRNERAADPYVRTPEGRVRLSSVLGNGQTSVTSLTFGANPSLPTGAQEHGFEGTNELSWISPNGGHRVKLGGLLNVGDYRNDAAFNRFGSWTYNSLDDFIDNRPAQYVRNLAPTVGAGSAINSAVYLGDTWRKSRAFQLTYGGRLEGSRFGGAPALNQRVLDVFGLRTDRFASEVHFSPRVGFTYTRFPAQQGPNSGGNIQRQQRPGAGLFAGGPTLFVRGGIGEFRGRTPTTLYAGAQQGAGLGGETQLVCTGLNVPVPDWAGYANGTAPVPATCLDGGSGVPVAAAPTVTAFAPGFEAPRSWRLSLGVTRRFWERWALTVDGQYARGVAQYGVRDVNLDTQAEFTVDDEGGRPVFAPASAISPITGLMPVQASRRDPAFAQVYAIGSGLESRNAQVTTALNAFTRRGIVFNLSYTWARSRDQSSFAFGPASFGFSGPTTAGNPNEAEWATSDLERRHNVLGTVTWPLNPSLELTFIGRAISGGAYTPLVGSDVNGDGARNDRAFVFDPASVSADPAVAPGMQRLLASAPAEARRCLEGQLGRVAARNACRQGMWATSDFQLNYRPDRLGLERRLSISFIAENTLGGIDRLLHGEEGLRGWGQPTRADNTLLFVRGFDPATRRYRYEVNERFGNSAGQAQAIRSPFRLTIQARVAVGQSGPGFGGFGGAGGRGPGGGVRIMMAPGAGFAGAAAAFNPVAQLIEMRDSLGLSDEQVKRLEPIRDTLAAKATKLGEEIRAAIAKLGNNPDPALVFPVVRPKLAEGRAHIMASRAAAQQVLTAEQWAKVPERVKNAFDGQFGAGAGQQLRQRP